MSGTEIAGTFLIDGHVHHHAGVVTDTFLEGAGRNFDAAATRRSRPADAYWLLLTELPNDHWFEALQTGDVRPKGWQVANTDEPESLVLERPGRPPLIVLAGRQVATREGLEVLALGTRSAFEDGRGLDESVAAVQAAGALAVLPYGFGKWSGRRASLVERYLETAPRPFFLGDNGGRLALSPAPRAFALAAERGIVVLPGSDPLPLPGEDQKVGRYGFVLEGAVERARPAAGLRRLLGALDEQPEVFGHLEGVVPFVVKQVAMQWRKRIGNRPG